MSLWTSFWIDESGAVLSAEAALLGTVGVVGSVVGLSALSDSLGEELKETAFAIRSLDQSYSYEGHRTPRAWTAGSSFTQRPVKVSQAELQRRIDLLEKKLREQDQEIDASVPGEKLKRHDPDANISERQNAASDAIDSEWKIDGPALKDR